MNIGKFDKLLIIEQPVYETTSAGQRIVSDWEEYTRVWGRFELKTTNEDFQDNIQNVSEYKVRIYARYASGITAKMRVNHDSNYYYIIHAPFEIERKKNIQFDAIIKDNG